MALDQLDEKTETSLAAEADREEEEEDLELEAALLALSEDMAGPTEDVDLGALSPTEKRALLHCLRARLGVDY